jgi:hypothetical protein
MSTKKSSLIIFLFIIICSAFTFQHTVQFKNAEWLIGTWENKTARGSVYETWHKVNNRDLVGISYILKEKDTVVFERIRLVEESGSLFYIPAVVDQNNGMPVRFLAKNASETKLVFENPQHDFPQTISYTRVGSDSLVAEIAGKKAGKERKQQFRMKKVK